MPSPLSRACATEERTEMPLILLIVLIAVPLLELAVIIKVGGSIGVLPTILLLVGVAILGTVLLRSQSRMALRRASEALSSGRPPVDSVVDAVGLLIAGALMLTPGFLTDIIGLLLLIPPLRRRLARWIFAKAAGRVVFGGTGFNRGPEKRPGPGTVIEGEFRRIDEDDRNG
jgi:UPF0716 protein FxsA